MAETRDDVRDLRAEVLRLNTVVRELSAMNKSLNAELSELRANRVAPPTGSSERGTGETGGVARPSGGRGDPEGEVPPHKQEGTLAHFDRYIAGDR